MRPIEIISHAQIDKAVALGPLIILFGRFRRRGLTRAQGVLVGPEQLPGVANFAAQVAHLAGLRRPPQLVITTASGPLSDSFGGQGGTVVLHYDLFEICRANGDYAPLRFAIAREMGRFALGHHGRWRQLWTFLPSVTPVVRGVLARVEGYSADRAGALLQGDAAGDYLTLVAGSKVLWAILRPQALVAQTSQRDLSTWAAIFTAAAAPVAWRAAALADVVGAQLPGDRRGVIQLTYHRFQGDLAAACQAGAAGRTRRPRGGIFRPPHLPR